MITINAIRAPITTSVVMIICLFGRTRDIAFHVLAVHTSMKIYAYIDSSRTRLIIYFKSRHDLVLIRTDEIV